MIKPIKIAFFFIGLQLCLGLMIFYFPDSGIQITEGFTLRFSKVKDFLPDKISELEVLTEIQEEYSLAALSSDTLKASEVDSSILNAPLVIAEEERIIHPSDFENGLFTFYQQLANLKNSKKALRVLHFGDSQIEGDRISGIVRDNLQSIFGGCGVGFLPISEGSYTRKSISKKETGWDRYQIFGTGQHGVHKKYGLLGYYHQIHQGQDGVLELSGNKNYFQRAQEFETISFMYGNSKEVMSFEIKSDTGIIDYGLLESDEKFHIQKWNIKGFDDEKLALKFKAKNVNIYGISLDCNDGLAVDNIPMRGSSGTEFTKIDKAFLKSQLKDLNVGLIIYQFGVNVVPSVLNDYTFYERMVYNQLKLLKELLPNVSILVVGVSDMSMKEGDTYKSYPNILKIRQAQMNAAKKANCSFWDLYAVMGGDNSMPSWVFANPSLAEKDFIHFNARGAKVIGNKLFNALISDYNDFKSTDIQ